MSPLDVTDVFDLAANMAAAHPVADEVEAEAALYCSPFIY